MKTIIKSLVIAVAFSTVSLTTFSVSALDRAPRSAAAYQVGTYSSNNGTKLNVAVDKQKGGRVDIRLKDAAGNVLFIESLGKKEEKWRTRLNIGDLPGGSYQLEISNGVDTVVRTIQVTTREVTSPIRTITLL